MAGDGFEVDLDRLTDRAGSFDGLARRVESIHRDLGDRLAATGACWGADDVGRSFAAVHVQAADATLGSVGGLPDRLGDVGNRFRATAEAYRGGESDNVRVIGSVDS